MNASQRFRALILGLIALHACMATVRVAGTLWVLRQGHDERVVGAVISLFAVAPIVLAMWAGRQADRYGLQRPVVWGLTMAVVGTVACAGAPSLWSVAFASLMTGGALSVAAVAIQREAGRMADGGDDLKRIFSWLALGPALSNTLAPLACGLIIDHLGLDWAFVWAALLPFLSYALLARVGRQLAKNAPPVPVERKPAWDLLRRAPLRQLLLVNLCMAAAWDAHTFAVPVVGHARDMSASQIGLILSSFAVAATAVRLGIVRWASRLEERRMLRTAMVLAATVLAAYVWMPGLWGLMAASAVLGLALGSVQPMVLSMLHQVTPSDRHGQALGLRMMVTNAATVAMPMAFGLLSATVALALPLWAMAAALLLVQWGIARVWASAPPNPE